MNKLFLSLLFINLSFLLFAQKTDKPSIDTSVFNKWMAVENPAIDNAGNFFLYYIKNKPAGNQTLVLQSLENDTKVEMIGANRASFTDDSQAAIFFNSKDSLCILRLSNTSIEFIPQVKSFKLFMQGKTEWLLYILKIPVNKLVVRNLQTGRQLLFNDVQDFWQSSDGKILVLKTESGKENNKEQLLNWVTIENGKTRLIWRGNNIGNVLFDLAGSQLVFISDAKDTISVAPQKGKSYWYYRSETDQAIELINDQSIGKKNDLQLDRISRFSRDGRRLFFYVKERGYPKADPRAVKVDVWSYKDTKLQSKQSYELTSGGSYSYGYASVINLENSQIIDLQQRNENTTIFSNSTKDDVAIISKNNGGDEDEWNWNSASRPVFSLVSTITGKRKQLNINYPYWLSPNGRYIIGTDMFMPNMNNNLISYNISTGNYVNLTKSLPVPFGEGESKGKFRQRGLTIGAWLSNDEAILVYDKYDIWQIDPSGRKQAINLTNGYGRRNNITFRLPFSNELKSYNEKQYVILSSFNWTNKNNGFYRIVIGQTGNPQLLSEGPYIYNVYTSNNFSYIFSPLKARDTGLYIVERQSVNRSPNYYLTSNFKTFKSLTHVYPEEKYNWLTSELLTFKTTNGFKEQGVLYKPENFNPHKKYPVIIHFYETLSDHLNKYLKPDATSDNINIPWFVSNGYLVFTPDIHYSLGMPGQGVYNSVVAAKKYLQGFTWVNASRIGIQGHSWGGYETNYLVTHTNIFAAAMSSSGISDMISDYGTVAFPEGFSKQYFYEVHQTRLGATLWQRPDLYLKNSPIFNADKVMTPLLMMNNKKDPIVSFNQGVEFFTALRRLGKKAWMLQYDNGSHSVIQDENTKDYTVRITQFFDHYLKGAPAPEWMTRGVPASMKGIDTGYNLDPNGNCHKDCKICKEVNFNAANGKVNYSLATFGLPKKSSIDSNANIIKLEGGVFNQFKYILNQ